METFAVMSGQAYGSTPEGLEKLSLAGYLPPERFDDGEAAVFTPINDVHGVDSGLPVVLAFRGTVPNNPADIITDTALAAGPDAFKKTPRFRRSFELARKIAAAADKGGHPLALTGHSLGGTLALEVAADLSPKRPAYAFNPGVPVFTPPGRGRLPDGHPDTVVYRSKGDPVSITATPRVGVAADAAKFLRRPTPLAAIRFLKSLGRRSPRAGPRVETQPTPTSILSPLQAHSISALGGFSC